MKRFASLVAAALAVVLTTASASAQAFGPNWSDGYTQRPFLSDAYTIPQPQMAPVYGVNTYGSAPGALTVMPPPAPYVEANVRVDGFYIAGVWYRDCRSAAHMNRHPQFPPHCRTAVNVGIGNPRVIVGTQGQSRGTPTCRHWPGTTYNPRTNTCDVTKYDRALARKYDRPGVGCKLGEKVDVRVPLPNGGTRTFHGTCRLDASMRGK